MFRNQPLSPSYPKGEGGENGTAERPPLRIGAGLGERFSGIAGQSAAA